MITWTAAANEATDAGNRPLPPLANGDHLTLAEFERRYVALPHINKAELIEGVVHMPSPVSLEHSHRHAAVMLWLGQYRAATTGLRLLDNATIRLDLENVVQPDAALCLANSNQNRVDGEYLSGAPELIVEIAATSAAYDLHEKLRVYRRSGVREYIVLLTHEQETVWYYLDEGRYLENPPGEDGVIRSRIFPGLWFSPKHFWSDDLVALLATLQAGLTTPEHGRFVDSLGAQAQ